MAYMVMAYIVIAIFYGLYSHGLYSYDPYIVRRRVPARLAEYTRREAVVVVQTVGWVAVAGV